MGNWVVQALRRSGFMEVTKSESSVAKGCLFTFNRIIVNEEGERDETSTVCNNETEYRYLNVLLFYTLFYYLVKIMLLSTQ
jgi:hypothetical protein